MRPTHNETYDNILAEILELELVSQEDVDRAVHAAQQDGVDPVTYHLVRLGIISSETLTPILAHHFEVPAIDFTEVKVDPAAAEMISVEMALRYRALPVSLEGNRLTIAMANPQDLGAIEDLRYSTQMELEVVVADPFTIQQRIDRTYNRSDDRIGEALVELQGFDEVERVDENDDDDDEYQEQIDDAPIVKLVSGILHEAVRRKASDIHIEPYENRIRVRYRVDGVLTEVYRLPKHLRNPIISRIKIMSDLNIGEKRKPQDGRTKLRVGQRIVDYRVSTMPTAFGEKVVLRILDKSAINLDLDTLGIGDRNMNIIELNLASPYGMIITTGPTGSGKTTTLYSMLIKVNTGKENILSVEDPIEYDLPGINQVQVNTEIDLSFASVLRSFLRQDPDVIMVGEMRDGETAKIALQAALTGHLVLSTLHTNDAASAFMRLINLGCEPHNVANAVSTVIAQRLVRRVCQNCKVPAEYDEEYLRFADVREEEMSDHPFVVGAGCDACDGVGYRGRLGLYEVLPVTPAILNLIMEGASTHEIKATAIREGLRTLREIGMEHARNGLTTLEEVVLHTRK